MNIVVCVKPVPDASIVTVDARRSLIDRDDLVYIVNPYDMAAVEEAVRIRERYGGRVTLISVAPPSNRKLLQRCLAVGADEAINIWDNNLDNLDSHAAGAILAGAIHPLQYDLILCGQKAIDTEAGQTGSIIAETLDIPLASRVVKIDVAPDGKKVSVESKLEKGNRARVEISLPALLAVEADLNELRYASLPSLMAGLKKQIKECDLKAIRLSHGETISELVKTRIIAVSLPKPRPKKVFTPDSQLPAAERLRLIMSGGVTQKQTGLFQGAPENIASTIVRFLSEKKFISKTG